MLKSKSTQQQVQQQLSDFLDGNDDVADEAKMEAERR